MAPTVWPLQDITPQQWLGAFRSASAAAASALGPGVPSSAALYVLHLVASTQALTAAVCTPCARRPSAMHGPHGPAKGGWGGEGEAQGGAGYKGAQGAG